MNERNFPFNQMAVKEIDGVRYVFIPNIWVRNEKLAAGATYEECFAYMISDKPKTGYHIHPSFMTNGRNTFMYTESLFIDFYVHKKYNRKNSKKSRKVA